MGRGGSHIKILQELTRLSKCCSYLRLGLADLWRVSSTFPI
jgi:hypothetical protein